MLVLCLPPICIRYATHTLIFSFFFFKALCCKHVHLFQDFLLMSYICFTYGVPLPFIAADEAFGSIAMVHHVLRRAGAFFVSRAEKKGRGDQAERAFMRKLRCTLLQLFVTCIAKRYGVLEIFIEGGRSKTGEAADSSCCCSATTSNSSSSTSSGSSGYRIT